MLHFAVIERERKGNFDIQPGVYGKLNVVSTVPFLTGIAESSNVDDFSFSIPVSCGKIEFNVSSMNGKKYDRQTLAITGSSDSSITFTFNIITPFNEISNEPIDLKFPKHFTIGHRGSGNNLCTQDYQENAIPGFLHASQVGCEFIEFDIQLSKEKIPVIHHDYVISRKEKHPEIGEPLLEDPPGTYQYALNQHSVDQFRVSKLDLKWKQELPTFSDLLLTLPPQIKFDIEVKFPFQPKNKHIPYTERNEFIDIILHEVSKDSGNRKFFFSTFDVDSLLMLCFKQHKYPVFMLMTQETEDTFEYFVTKIIGMAPLLKHIGVKGYIIDSTFLLKETSLIKKLLDQGFSVSTYGKPNNEEKYIVEQLDLGISGICTDFLDMANHAIIEYEKTH
ncbi:Glycerophosphocholine phosphodiesterase gpcpd1 [Tritrichomonas musculus]|uniref:Glycerophosphocholine phosphodiesterase gpcpd1 n=1 Tax=Tritrichomonas musculus TaxID=1915356 RepID=A0ABR2JLJ5_9EUKA